MIGKMMDKLMALFGLLRKGAEVADAEKWKAHQITGNMIGGVLLAAVFAAKAYGYDLPMDEESAVALGGGIVAGFNVVFTAITSKRAGLLPAKAE